MVAIERLNCKRLAPVLAVFVTVIALLGCERDTSRLSPELESRFTGEGLLRRADNAIFRYTHGLGTREAGWEERLASIVVTRQSVYIHKNEKVGLEINTQSRRICGVERDHGRVRVRAGTGQSAEVWSFVPPDDAEGWARDIRAVIRGRSAPPLP